MKKFRLLLMIAIAALFGSQILFAQSKREKKEQKEKAVKELIDQRQFSIEVDRALPMTGRAVNLTSSYSLEVRGDSVISYLPYFGRAYNLPYGGGEGLRFEEQLTDYDLSYDKKGTAKIKFESRTKEDNFTFNVEVFPNGRSTINVTPVNRQGITFHGEISVPEK